MKFEKPGAGLPNLERLFIKNILVPSVRLLFTWDIALLLLNREVRIISKLIESIEENRLCEKPIIDRTFAIEDDTRQYSVNMVLEHLSIAGYGIMDIIDTLSKEEEFKEEITIVGVKAHINGVEAMSSFKKFMKTYDQFIKELPKKQSLQTQRHPWFVEFNNFDWSVFMYMHTFIHRRQIEAIILKLKQSNV